MDDIAAAKTLTDGHTSALDQLILAQFISGSGYDRHVRRSRLAYRRRLVTALHCHAPHVRITGIAAGLHALLKLPASCHEGEVVTRAARHGLALEGLQSYSAAEGRPGTCGCTGS